MKKSALLLSTILLLTLCGCNKTSVAESDSEPDFVLKLDSISETESTETTSAETTAVSTTVTETETIETTQAASETTEAPTSETETQPAGRTDVESLVGKWEFLDGYWLHFLEGGTVELSLDISWDMRLQKDTLYYMEQEYPVSVSGNTITAKSGDKTILQITAEDGADAAAMDGRFRLEPCQVYQDQLMDDNTEQVYYIDLHGSAVRLVSPANYEASEGVLRMINGEDTVDFTFVIQEDVLTITDKDDVKDVLTRIE